MTYKAIRRKSDKQWMQVILINKAVYPCLNPELWTVETGNQISKIDLDWSLYELVTVHCIAEDELPNQADAVKDCDEYYALLEGEKDNADLHYFAGEMNIINKLK